MTARHRKVMTWMQPTRCCATFVVSTWASLGAVMNGRRFMAFGVHVVAVMLVVSRLGVHVVAGRRAESSPQQLLLINRRG